MMKSDSEHWNGIFSTKRDSQLGWYEKNATQTFELLNKIPAWEKSTIFLTGVAEELLNKGVGLVLNDISAVALEKLKKALLVLITHI